MTETCANCASRPDPDFPDFEVWHAENQVQHQEFWDMMTSSGEQYYDHDATAISYSKWEYSRQRDPAYQTVTHWQHGQGFVSTVLLGKDLAWDNGPLMIFETMVFNVGGWRNVFDRYGSATAAVRGHDSFVAAIEAGQSYEDWLDQ